jgi:hypothetical protein
MDEKVYIYIPGSKAQGPTNCDEETQEKKDGQLKSIGGKKTHTQIRNQSHEKKTQKENFSILGSENSTLM